MSPVRILLVDDHILFRSGLARLLGADPRFEVTGEAANGVEFLELLAGGEHTDVVMLDIDMPVMGGAEAATEALARYPDLKIITLSMHGEQEYYFRMVSIGVKGFLVKNSAFNEVAVAIMAVMAGGNYFSQELLRGIVPARGSDAEQTVRDIRSPRGGSSIVEQSYDYLSPRELEILLLICRGESNQQIADRLFISKRTVDNHRANILEKTGCKNTASLVVYAIKHSLIAL